MSISKILEIMCLQAVGFVVLQLIYNHRESCYL